MAPPVERGAPTDKPMTRLDLEQHVKQILTNRLGIPPDEITTSAKLVDDLGMDSLDAVELAIAAERQFHVSISDEQVARLGTVADIVQLVERLAGEQRAAT